MMRRLVIRCSPGGKQSITSPGGRRLCTGRKCLFGQAAAKQRVEARFWATGKQQGLRSLTLGAVGTSVTAFTGYSCYRLLSAWDQTEDVELPAVPEPSGHFVHPYETWPWYQKAWFALKRSAPPLTTSLYQPLYLSIFLTSFFAWY